MTILTKNATENELIVPVNDFIEFSYFYDAYDNMPKRQLLPWQELQPKFEIHNHKAKDRCPRVTFTTYKPGATRSKENVISTTAMVLDFDENTPPWNVTRSRLRAAVVRYLAYSTTRHTLTRPRYRVILPLLAPIPPARHKSTFDKVNHFFADDLADKSFGTNQSHMANFPNCPKENVADAWTCAEDGKLLDPDTLPEPPKTQQQAINSRPSQDRLYSHKGGKERYLETVISRECATITETHEGRRNNATNRASFKLGQFVGGNELLRKEVERRIVEAAVSVGLPVSEARRTVASGMGAGMQAPRTVPEAKYVNQQ